MLGGDDIGHCEKKYSYKHVLNFEWFPRYSCWNLQTQKHCNWSLREISTIYFI